LTITATTIFSINIHEKTVRYLGLENKTARKIKVGQLLIYNSIQLFVDISKLNQPNILPYQLPRYKIVPNFP
jgi:hypothetical protein